MSNKKKRNTLVDFLSQKEKYKEYLDKYYNLPNRMNTILSNLKLYKESTVFLNKVTKKEAPDYHKIIKKPIDFATIHKKIVKYRGYEEFKEDLELVWTNCYTYNAGPYYIYCADTMKRAVKTQEIPRLCVPMDCDYKPPEIRIDGLLGVKDKREELKRIVMNIVKSNGYDLASNLCLEILCDLLSVKICKLLHENS